LVKKEYDFLKVFKFTFRTSTSTSGGSGANLIKLFFLRRQPKKPNKLEHLSLSSPYSLVQYLQARLEPTRVKYLSGTPIKGKIQILAANIRPLACIKIQIAAVFNYVV
jgi:hypothetical protein